VAILDNMWQKLASPHEDLSLAYQFIERLTAALPVREPTTSTSTTAAAAATEPLPSDSSEPPHQHHQPGGVGDNDNMERKEGEGTAAADQPQDKWTLVAAYWRRRIDQLLYQLIARGDTARAQGLVELMVRRWQIQPNRRSVTMHIKTSVREAVARAAAAASAGQGHGRDGGEVARLAKMVEEGELEADGITFTALIDANGRLGRKAEALRLYELMRARGVERDAGTYKVLLITCAVAKDKHEGLRLLALAEQDGMALDEGPLAAVTSTIRSLPDPSSPAPPPSP
jgi:pentatricopeptide repeat protein